MRRRLLVNILGLLVSLGIVGYAYWLDVRTQRAQSDWRAHVEARLDSLEAHAIKGATGL